MHKEITDHKLITLFKKGSMEAMEKIVDRYENQIFNFGLKMCSHLQDAEDILQETFLSAFRYLGDFRGETKLKNWLFMIAARACQKKRRKRKFEPEQELSLDSFIQEDGSHTSLEIPDWSDDPSDMVLRVELKQVINNAIKALPRTYRLVFNLRDIQGFSTKETAELLGISKESVKIRLHRARLFLRKEISTYFTKGKNQ